MRNYFKIGILVSLMAVCSCSDQIKEDKIGRNYDVTFNEHQLDRFSFKVFNTPFESGDEKSGIISFNTEVVDGELLGGFLLSNKNWRSYPWCFSEDFGADTATDKMKKEAIDSCRYSVYTNYGNTNQTYAVARVNGDKAFFTLKTPSVIEHILVANTTYNFLLMTYGSYYSDQLDSKTQFYVPFKINDATGEIDQTKPALIANPKIPDVAIKGRFSLPSADRNPMMRLAGASIIVKRKAGKIAADAARAAGKQPAMVYADSIEATKKVGDGWFKLTIKGYRNNTQVGSIDYYLGSTEGAVKDFPLLNKIKEYWYSVDLTSLGEVDKVVFNMDSSDKDENGNMRQPNYFCLDGIRLKNRVR